MNWPYWDDFAHGLIVTLEVTALSSLGALILGAIIASFRISPIRVLRLAGATYVEVIKNIPLLVLVFIAVYGLPQLAITVPLFWSVVIVLAIYEGAFACEALRTGILGVHVGTTEAGRALGLRTMQVLTRIVLPQALRSVVQPLGNVFIKTALNSSLIAIVGLADLTGVALRINIREAEPVLFIISGLAYVCIALIGGQVFGRIDKRVRFDR